MSRHRSDSAGAGSASDKDILMSPSSQAAPTSPSQATLVQTSPKDNALSEKYKKLKRRFFELEEVSESAPLFLDHKERKSPDSRTDVRNTRKPVRSCNAQVNVMFACEKNESVSDCLPTGSSCILILAATSMLLDRIIELEAQSQEQSEVNGSPTSPSFPRTLTSPRARTSFVENLRQAFAEDDDTDDNVDPVSPSRHLGAQARKKTDDEHEVREAKRPIRRARASHPPSDSPRAKESATTVHSLATASPTRIPEEAYQIPDAVTSVEREAPVASPENQSIPFPGSPGPSMPPMQLETPRQSPVFKSISLSHADTPSVDRQIHQPSPNRMTSHDDAITDVAMADGTSHEASGHDVQFPIDETNAEALSSHHVSVNVVTQVAPDAEKPVDKENANHVPPTTTLVKKDGKKAPTRGAKAKGGKKNSARVEAEQSGSPPSSRRSARLARNIEAPTENEVGTRPVVPVVPGSSAQSSKSSANTLFVNPSPLRIEHQNSTHTHVKMFSPSQASESHFSASASPPPPSEPVTELSSPTTTRHTLDLIDPLLKQAGAAPSTDVAATSQPSEPTSVSPSPSLDSNNIVRVAAAVIAAQNAARGTKSGSKTSGSEIASPGASSAQTQGASSNAAGDASGLTSPSPISSNPYLALSAVKPSGSPVNMPPMMPPMNPYSMYYPAPSSPGVPPYPYANPYYYMSPMAGPSNVYSPPPSTDSPPLNAQRSPSDSQRQTKPKRLKAHTVTSKQFSIPMVPRDKNGKPMLPLNVGIMTVINLGTVCMREHFHTERYIFPVGYEVTR